MFHLIVLTTIAVLAISPTQADPIPTPTADARTTPFTTQDNLYSYAYAIDVPEYKNFFDHEEDRTGEITQGRFRVALPDNRLQTVTYRAGVRGYQAQISYDRHPNFESLRGSVTPNSPIREGPSHIGQSVISGIQRGENWQNRDHAHRNENQRNNAGPSSRPATSGRNSGRNSSPFRPPPVSLKPMLTPPPPPPPSSPFNNRRKPATSSRPQQRPRPTPTTRAPQSIASSHFGPVAQRLTSSNGKPSAPRVKTSPSSSRPRGGNSRQTSPRPQRQPAQIPPQASLFVSTEPLVDPQILNRLTEAIRLKSAEETPLGGESSSGEKKQKPRYSISDKEAVIAKLRAIVHRASIPKI